MKKLLITIIFILFTIKSVGASTNTYYSEYSDYGPQSDVKPEETELVDVKKTIMYKYYKEEKNYGDYYLINNNNELFPYADTNDFIKTGYTDWSENIPQNQVGRSIKNRDIYYYQNMKKIRYIHFTDIKGGKEQLNINEIIVTENNHNIPYTIYCNGCSTNFFEKITNEKINYENSYLLYGGYLRLDLGEYYNISDLNVKFYITDISNSEKRYSLSTSREEPFNSKIYSNVMTKMYFKHNDYNEIKEISHKLDEINLISPEWETKIKSYNPIIATKTRKVEQRKEYSYQDTLYRHYNYQKNYTNDYYEESPLGYPIKDESEYIEYYQSRYRDKVTLKSKIIIENEEQKLEDFVVENTTNELNINGIINYEENGVYEVTYIFPFIQLDKLVYVNIAPKEESKDDGDEDMDNNDEDMDNDDENVGNDDEDIGNDDEDVGDDDEDIGNDDEDIDNKDEDEGNDDEDEGNDDEDEGNDDEDVGDNDEDIGDGDEDIGNKDEDIGDGDEDIGNKDEGISNDDEKNNDNKIVVKSKQSDKEDTKKTVTEKQNNKELVKINI
ncbi:MAG: hypothetical protein PHX03_05170, partial [Bacilli bacterium]|nr:hypothetical protein [Bacilli bacterium]